MRPTEWPCGSVARDRDPCVRAISVGLGFGIDPNGSYSADRFDDVIRSEPASENNRCPDKLNVAAADGPIVVTPSAPTRRFEGRWLSSSRISAIPRSCAQVQCLSPPPRECFS